MLFVHVLPGRSLVQQRPVCRPKQGRDTQQTPRLRPDPHTRDAHAGEALDPPLGSPACGAARPRAPCCPAMLCLPAGPREARAVPESLQILAHFSDPALRASPGVVPPTSAGPVQSWSLPNVTSRERPPRTSVTQTTPPPCCPCPAKRVPMATSLTPSRCYRPWLGHRDARPQQMWVRAHLRSGQHPQHPDQGPPLMRGLQHEGQGWRWEVTSAQTALHPLSPSPCVWEGDSGQDGGRGDEGPGMTLGASECRVKG